MRLPALAQRAHSAYWLNYSRKPRSCSAPTFSTTIRRVATGPYAPLSSKEPTSRLIGTHNGVFHRDEALAVFLLRQTDAYRDAGVKRTREPAILDSCDAVVDVGAIYDETRQRFDHHQRGFEEVFGHDFFNQTILCRPGIQEIIAKEMKTSMDDPKVTTLWLKMYKDFIEAVDAVDNGIPQYNTDEHPKYRNLTDLSSRIALLNPAWNERLAPDAVDSLFMKASSLAGEEFLARLRSQASSWLPSLEVVTAAFSSRFDVNPSGRLLLLEPFVPWKGHLADLEAEAGIVNDAKVVYVIYPGQPGDTWRVQATPASRDAFESRKALPEAWRGESGDELSELTGVEGCIFVHASGFIGGNKTRDGALRLARLALAA